MAGNGNIQQLSCDDSALSINIIGILTLAYAIIITLAFRVNQLLAAKKTLKNLGDRLLDEVCTLEFASEWVQDLIPHIPEELKYEARAVQNFEVPVKKRFIKDLISEDAYTPAWLILFQQGNFLARRAEAETYLERFVWARREMQNFGHKVTQSIIMKQVEGTNEIVRQQSELINQQIALVNQLSMPSKPTDQGKMDSSL